LKELFEELFKNKNKITKTESLLNETRTDLPNYINFK
jgi:hypothetical protein